MMILNHVLGKDALFLSIPKTKGVRWNKNTEFTKHYDHESSWIKGFFMLQFSSEPLIQTVFSLPGRGILFWMLFMLSVL